MSNTATLEQVEALAAQLPPAQQLKLVARIGERLSEALPPQVADAALPVAQPGQPTAANPLAGLKFADMQALRPIIDKAFTDMGIDITQPAPTPEEVQELMLREGVRPEDNIFSRGIIEMREE